MGAIKNVMVWIKEAEEQGNVDALIQLCNRQGPEVRGIKEFMCSVIPCRLTIAVLKVYSNRDEDDNRFDGPLGTVCNEIIEESGDWLKSRLK